MAEELDTQQEEQQDEGKSLWEILQREQEQENESEEYEDEQDQQDELEKKLSAKLDKMNRKFEETMLRERIGKFEESADELTLDMFKTIASDVNTVEDFDRAVGLVAKQAAELRKKAEAYQEQLNKQAEESTAKAWGTGPIGATPVKRTPDYEEQLMERIKAGDESAAFEAIVGDDLPH
jgi:hypothetical protein